MSVLGCRGMWCKWCGHLSHPWRCADRYVLIGGFLLVALILLSAVALIALDLLRVI